MVWAGSPFGQRLEFSTGLPTGAVSYQLLGNDGSVLIDSELTPADGAIAATIIIPGANNGCAADLFENRTLTWHYETTDGLVADRVVYRVLRPLPFSASADGVRQKLGIEAHELKDDLVDLTSAYAEFLTYGDATPYQTTGDRNTLLCVHAIEALAALEALATLQVKIAASETSGTNEFRRYGNVDWAWIEVGLLAHVARARQLLDQSFDAAGGDKFTFGTAGRESDAVTSEAN